MKPRWRNFDHWWVKVVAFLLIIGSVWWMAYAIQWHYHMEHLAKAPVAWEIVPFIVGGLFTIFALAILSRKLTEGAASVVLPFAQLVIERFGGKKDDAVSMKVTPPAPGQKPAGTVTVTQDTEIPDRGDK